jgi:hypothetical protein
MIPEPGLHFTRGELNSFQRTDIENAVTRHFCSSCGTAVGTTTPGAPGVFVMKVGTMDDAAFFKPDMAIFAKDAMSFHHIPDDLPNFEELPPGF